MKLRKIDSRSGGPMGVRHLPPSLGPTGRIQRGAVFVTLQRHVVFVQAPVPRRLVLMTAADLPADWWTTDHVRTYLASVGAPISRATWASYVSRGQAPAPDRMFGRSPAWQPETIRKWQTERPRRGATG
jgi:predicted DNA-binding transcriptional regulator AlpA